MGKKVGEEIVLEDEYSSKHREMVVEQILTIENYVMGQSIKYFTELTEMNSLRGVQRIEVRQEKGDADFS